MTIKKLGVWAAVAGAAIGILIFFGNFYYENGQQSADIANLTKTIEVNNAENEKAYQRVEGQLYLMRDENNRMRDEFAAETTFLYRKLDVIEGEVNKIVGYLSAKENGYIVHVR